MELIGEEWGDQLTTVVESCGQILTRVGQDGSGSSIQWAMRELGGEEDFVGGGEARGGSL